jgi:adenine-specific DNA-methyltransferase
MDIDRTIMTTSDFREKIVRALAKLGNAHDFFEAAEQLFAVLGYRSERRLDLGDTTPSSFEASLGAHRLGDKAQTSQWRSIEMLFQIGREELVNNGQSSLLASQFEPQIYHAFLFYLIDLKPKADGRTYSRSELAEITRELNRIYPMPVSVLFRYKHGQQSYLSLAIVTHRPNKRDSQRDVLEKVSLIHAIRAAQPHRAHIDILGELALEQLREHFSIANFEDLQRAWARTLDTSELNKRFYRELSDWYFAAHNAVVFPEGAGEPHVRNATSLIRLLTRLMFVWFLREKNLLPDALFKREELAKLLYDLDPESSTYYKAILQNLFFATLNTEMDRDSKQSRRFRGKNSSGGRDSHFGISSVYRYEDAFRDPDQALALFRNIPFLNGGLFECLDPSEKRTVDNLVDGFSEMKGNPLQVPNKLFFGGLGDVDLNDVYGTRGRRSSVRGLIDIFTSYKFTIAENTPIEEEVALDPELLGHVFENLLAAYNPETRLTARKETGSFYTPRNVVDYMVDESLVLLLRQKLGRDDGETNQKLRQLLAYNDPTPADELFSASEQSALIRAVDELRVIDPACGSGAFPMGVLQKLVHLLSKIDPKNQAWKQRQLEHAEEIEDIEAREDSKRAIEEAFERNELGYGRKLFLIENCIYGVDIQPIAVQIAKLRFFIALLVDQGVDEGQKNRGVRPLPNLETRLVTANSLTRIDYVGQQLALFRSEIEPIEQELKKVRSRHFSARTIQTKQKYRDEDRKLRTELASILSQSGLPSNDAELLANWNPYAQNDQAEFFDPEWMFGIANGFDLVIANPPYVRQEQLKDRKKLFQQQYPSVYSGTADLLVYFYGLALDLLRERGVFCFITSNKYLRAGYGKNLRSTLAKETQIQQLIDFGDAPIFTAIAYPSIILAEKRAPAEEHRLLALNWNPRRSLDEFDQEIEQAQDLLVQASPSAPLVFQRRLTPDGWRLEGEATQKLLDKLRRAGRPLGDYVEGRFYYGIKTGLNEAFVVDRATRDRLIAEHASSAELLKPYLRGRDVKRWRITSPDLWIITPPKGINILNYPAIHNHLYKFKDRLTPGVSQGRAAGNYQWFELQVNITSSSRLDAAKIVYPDIATKAEFAIDNSGFYPDCTLFYIPEVDFHLLSILNSSVSNFFINQIAPAIRGGYRRFKSIYVSQIPIPATSSTKAINGLVEQIIAAKEHNPEADISAWEDEINQRVYALYGLRSDEIREIEAALSPNPLSRDAGEGASEGDGEDED